MILFLMQKYGFFLNKTKSVCSQMISNTHFSIFIKIIYSFYL